jgi:hypothetical protein
MREILICTFLFSVFFVEAQVSQSQSLKKVVPIPIDSLDKYFDEISQVDYIFHGMGMSMAVENAEEAKANIAMLIPKSIEWTDCESIGKMYFLLADGRLLNTDLYHEGKCKFLIFLNENNKPAFGAELNERGQNLIEQVLSMRKTANPETNEPNKN